MEIGAILHALPEAALSPLAFVAYALVVAAWLVLALRVKRNKNLLKALDKLPPKDRLAAIQAEMGNVKPPKELTAEQWLRSRIHTYNFIWALAASVGSVLLIAVALVIGSTEPRSTLSDDVLNDRINDIRLNLSELVHLRVNNPNVGVDNIKRDKEVLQRTVQDLVVMQHETDKSKRRNKKEILQQIEKLHSATVALIAAANGSYVGEVAADQLRSAMTLLEDSQRQPSSGDHQSTKDTRSEASTTDIASPASAQLSAERAAPSPSPQTTPAARGDSEQTRARVAHIGVVLARGGSGEIDAFRVISQRSKAANVSYDMREGATSAAEAVSTVHDLLVTQRPRALVVQLPGGSKDALFELAKMAAATRTPVVLLNVLPSDIASGLSERFPRAPIVGFSTPPEEQLQLLRGAGELLPPGRPVYVVDQTEQRAELLPRGRRIDSTSLGYDEVDRVVRGLETSSSLTGILTSESSWERLEFAWRRHRKSDGALLFLTPPPLAVRLHLALSVVEDIISLPGVSDISTTNIFRTSRYFDQRNGSLVAAWTVHTFRMPKGFELVLDRTRARMRDLPLGRSDDFFQCCCKDERGITSACTACIWRVQACAVQNDKTEQSSCTCR